MRIVTWNIHRCIGLDRKYDPLRVVRVLKKLDADIIALQEVDSSLHGPDGRDQLTFLATELKMQSAMGPTLARDYGVYGNAILARHSIVQSSLHDLSFRKFEPRGALEVLIRVERTFVKFICLHLGLKHWERKYQATQIQSLLSRAGSSDEVSVVLLGDFNEWNRLSQNFREIAKRFNTGRRLATYPSRYPHFALDRIYLPNSFIAPVRYVAHGEDLPVASDHLPLVCDAALGADRDHVCANAGPVLRTE